MFPRPHVIVLSNHFTASLINIKVCIFAGIPLRGSYILNFSKKLAPNPTSIYGLVPTVLVFIQYTKMNIYPGNYHLFFLRLRLKTGSRTLPNGSRSKIQNKILQRSRDSMTSSLTWQVYGPGVRAHNYGYSRRTLTQSTRLSPSDRCMHYQ